MAAAIVLALLAALPGAMAQARIPAESVPFVSHLYDDPRSTDPIFAETWPGLIEANNKANETGFLHMKAEPGRNFGMFLDNATVSIPGGRVVLSIKSGPFAGCGGIGEHHDSLPRAQSCPARMTVYRNGGAITLDVGTLCRVGASTSRDSARAAYDPKANAIHVFVVIDGRVAERSQGDDLCEKTISLP